jgi:hypothetical protein
VEALYILIVFGRFLANHLNLDICDGRSVFAEVYKGNAALGRGFAQSVSVDDYALAVRL